MKLRTRNLSVLAQASLLALITAACSDEEPTVIGPEGNGGSTGNMTGSAGAAGGTAEQDSNVDVPASINADTTWTADRTYTLTGITYVEDGATLTIEPGTLVLGGQRSALIVSQGSRLVADGTAAEPIVFTSANPVGRRASGDWGGVVLLGSAPVNIPGAQIEGVDPAEGRTSYGGADAAHDCGSLSYVRIEFAGFEFSPDNELNGLTVGGCGTGTTLDYIQVHLGSDDGIEFFGGSADLAHAVVTGAQDDSIDWDLGWQGRGQFLMVQHRQDSDAGFEADNFVDGQDNLPRSQPTLYNLTLVGAGGSRSPGMVLRRGTWGTVRNAIVMGFPAGAVDIRDEASALGALAAPPALSVDNSLFFDNGADGLSHFTDDDTFADLTFMSDAARNNVMDQDPLLASTSTTAPSFVPAEGSPAATGGATPANDGFFDASATYMGAFEPGAASWAEGWTAYPVD
jgi:hypothetical protein